MSNGNLSLKRPNGMCRAQTWACGTVYSSVWFRGASETRLVILIEVEDEYELVNSEDANRPTNQTFSIWFCVLASDLFGNIISCSVFNAYSCFVNLLIVS